MTLPSMSSKSFYSLLMANGFTVLQSKHWETDGITRVVLGRNGQTYVHRIHARIIPAWEVIDKVHDLDLTIVPDECKEEYDQCMGAEKYKSFTAFQFTELVKGNKFTVGGENNVYYFDDNGELHYNGTKISNYEFRIENARMCLITTPPICQNESHLLVEFSENQSEIVLHLCTKEEEKLFAVLHEQQEVV